MGEKLIGIIGGSGLYQMEGVEGSREEEVKTLFGKPSDRYLVGRLVRKTHCLPSAPREG
jgi:5'-methylthioadenosine phosphorylase